MVSIGVKGSHPHRKNPRMLKLVRKMQLHIQCILVQLRPHVYVPEEPS
jgi:hypothetical protein